MSRKQVLTPEPSKDAFIYAVRAAMAIMRKHGNRAKEPGRGIYPLDALIASWKVITLKRLAQRAAEDLQLNQTLIDVSCRDADYDKQKVVKLYRKDVGPQLADLLSRFEVPENKQPQNMRQLKRRTSSAWKQAYNLRELLEELIKRR